MSDKQALRLTGITESDAYGTKRRFGLFSQPISHAIGDDGAYKTKLHPRDESGKPISKPRNFPTNPCRSGQLRKSFFGDLSSLATSPIPDEYIDPDRKLLQIANQTFKKGYKKESQFKPASGYKELHRSAYEYKEQNNPELDPKRNRQEDGRVKSTPRNPQTNQMSTVIHNLFKPLKHMDDPYDRKFKIESEKRKKDKSMEAEAAFKPGTNSIGNFNKDKLIYGEDVELKPKTARESNFNIFKHQQRWKVSNPNKKGLYGTFQPFPKYLESPPVEITRKPKDQVKHDVFRRMSIPFSIPSASITQNPTNLRKTFSNSFSHRV